MAQVEDLKIILKVQDAGGTQVVEKLKNQLAGLQRSANQASKSGIDEVARGIRAFDASGKKNIETLRGQISAMKALREQAVIGSAQFKRLSADVDKYSAALAKAEGQKKKGGGFAGRATKTVGAIAGAGVFGGVEGALGAGIGAFFGPGGAVVGGAIGAQVGGMRQALGATAEYAAGLKRLQIALLGVTTSQDEYAKALNFIQDTTTKFAIPQEVVTRQFTKLQASVQGAGGNLEDTKTAFNGIVAAVRATGGSLADVDAALTATAQVFSKGKVSAEELRQQIGERLPGAFTLFAQSMGKTPAELDKALEKGQVSLEDFQKFAESLFKRYGKTAEVIASGPEGAGDRLKVALEKMNENVGKILAPIGAAFQDTFAAIANAIGRAANALDLFLGVSPERRLNQVGEKIGSINVELAALRRKQREQEAQEKDMRPQYDPLGAQAAYYTPEVDYDLRIKNLELQRDRLRRESNEISRRLKLQADVAQAEPGTGLSYGGNEDLTKSGRKDISDLQRDARLAAIAARNNQESFELRRKALLLRKQAAIAAAEEEETNNRIVAIQKAKSDYMLGMLKLAKDIDKAEQDRLKKLEKIVEAEQAAAAARFGLRKGLGLTTKAEEVAEAQRRYRQQHGQFATSQDLDLIRQKLDPTLGESLQGHIRGLKGDLDKLLDPLNQVIGAANSIGTAFTNSFKSAITGSATAQQALSNFFRNIGNYFLDMAGKIIQKMIEMAILDQVVGLLPGLGRRPGLGSLSGSGRPGTPGRVSPQGLPYFGPAFAKGGVFANNKIVPYAMGGIVNKPTLFQYASGGSGRFGLLGEAGPEAIMPLRRGSNGKLGVEASGAGMGNVTVNVDASGSSVEGDAGQASQLGKAIGIAVQQELVKQKRPGGLLAS